jgi:uncharacterized cupin superfamily protein
MSEVFNLLDGELESNGRGFLNRSLGTDHGATLASIGVYELPAGGAGPEYHFELTREEWLFVVSGEVTLRTPAGERVLRAGDVTCFLPGPDGAHAVRNDGTVPARFGMTSTKEESRATVYPDAGRVFVVGPGFSKALELGE